VAEAAVSELLSFTKSGAAVDHHLADQLLLPMALASSRSSFSTNRITQHTMTNVSLLRQMMDMRIRVDGEIDQPGTVIVDGLGVSGD
jgi:RNA 3'-terminal phosphate cyclase (ATP)